MNEFVDLPMKVCYPWVSDFFCNSWQGELSLWTMALWMIRNSALVHPLPVVEGGHSSRGIFALVGTLLGHTVCLIRIFRRLQTFTAGSGLLCSRSSAAPEYFKWPPANRCNNTANEHEAHPQDSTNTLKEGLSLSLTLPLPLEMPR